MNRISLSIAALATVAGLTACSSDEADPAPSPSSSQASETETEAPDTDEPDTVEPADPGDQQADFQAAYTAVGALFVELNARSDDTEPASTEEANASAGLDETTDLVFADYTVLPEDSSTGSFCLESAPTQTYVAVTYSGSEGEVDLGEGECSYDTASAAVVGDIASDTWTTGGELMGDLTPQSVFGS